MRTNNLILISPGDGAQVRIYRELHLGAGEATGESAAAVVTTNDFGGGQVLTDLLEQVGDELRQVTGDGGYDDRRCYEAARGRKA